MQDDDRTLKNTVQRSFPPDAEPPPFDSTLAAAEARSSRPRHRYTAVAAGLALVAGLLVLNPGNAPTPDESSLSAELMNSTHWSAPSDALLPTYEFDIYRDLPALSPSTDVGDGALL